MLVVSCMVFVLFVVVIMFSFMCSAPVKRLPGKIVSEMNDCVKLDVKTHSTSLTRHTVRDEKYLSQSGVARKWRMWSSFRGRPPRIIHCKRSKSKIR